MNTGDRATCQGCGKPISLHAPSGHWNHVNTMDAPKCQGPKHPELTSDERRAEPVLDPADPYDAQYLGE